MSSCKPSSLQTACVPRVCSALPACFALLSWTYVQRSSETTLRLMSGMLQHTIQLTPTLILPEEEIHKMPASPLATDEQCLESLIMDQWTQCLQWTAASLSPLTHDQTCSHECCQMEIVSEELMWQDCYLWPEGRIHQYPCGLVFCLVSKWPQYCVWNPVCLDVACSVGERDVFPLSSLST